MLISIPNLQFLHFPKHFQAALPLEGNESDKVLLTVQDVFRSNILLTVLTGGTPGQFFGAFLLLSTFYLL